MTQNRDPDLPEGWGTINGEEHLDSVIARTNWNLAIDAACKVVRRSRDDWVTHPDVKRQSITLSLTEVLLGRLQLLKLDTPEPKR